MFSDSGSGSDAGAKASFKKPSGTRAGVIFENLPEQEPESFLKKDRGWVGAGDI